jgi:hypothetical protein
MKQRPLDETITQASQAAGWPGKTSVPMAGNSGAVTVPARVRVDGYRAAQGVSCHKLRHWGHRPT